MTSHENIRKRLDQQLNEYRVACRLVDNEKLHLSRITEELENRQKAQELLQTVAQKVQQQVHGKIAGIVSRCLQAVFPNPYEFRIDFSRKRGKTSARLMFIRNGHEIEEPEDGMGGGVIDVAAFALRLACLILSRPPRRRLLMLDEPMKHLSAEYRPAMRDILLALSKELNVQFIIVTHARSFMVGEVTEIS